MNCPVCEERLRDVEKAGLTVALCPACKGAWLDRAELAKLTAAASGAPAGDASAFQRLPDAREERDMPRDARDRRRDEEDEDDERGRGGKRRRGGFLESIGDLFGGD